MNLFGKALGLVGLATGGIAAAAKLIGNNKAKLKQLDDAYLAESKELNRIKMKLEQKALRGNKKAQLSLEEIDLKLKMLTERYEVERNRLLVSITRNSKEIETAKAEHQMDIEKAKVTHQMEMEKMKFEADHRIQSNETDKLDHTEGEIVCYKCGNYNSKLLKYCCKCGSQLLIKKYCSQCGSTIAAGARFCGECGEKIIYEKQ